MPGMHGPVDGCASIERIGAACCLAVTEVQPSGPYYLFGHSLGGLVVYEMARQFGARGESVNLVAMADTPYPENPRFWDYLRRFCSREGPSAVARRLHDVAGLVRARVRARYRKPAGRGKLSERASSERSVDFRAVMLRERHYVRRARPSTAPVALLRTRDTMERHCGGAPALRWEPYVTDSWEIHEIPGSHDSLLGEPYVRVLAATLAACLLRAQEQQ